MSGTYHPNPLSMDPKGTLPPTTAVGVSILTPDSMAGRELRVGGLSNSIITSYSPSRSWTHHQQCPKPVPSVKTIPCAYDGTTPAPQVKVPRHDVFAPAEPPLIVQQEEVGGIFPRRQSHSGRDVRLLTTLQTSVLTPERVQHTGKRSNSTHSTNANPRVELPRSTSALCEAPIPERKQGMLLVPSVQVVGADSVQNLRARVIRGSVTTEEIDLREEIERRFRNKMEQILAGQGNQFSVEAQDLAGASTLLSDSTRVRQKGEFATKLRRTIARDGVQSPPSVQADAMPPLVVNAGNTSMSSRNIPQVGGAQNQQLVYLHLHRTMEGDIKNRDHSFAIRCLVLQEEEERDWLTKRCWEQQRYYVRPLCEFTRSINLYYKTKMASEARDHQDRERREILHRNSTPRRSRSSTFLSSERDGPSPETSVSNYSEGQNLAFQIEEGEALAKLAGEVEAARLEDLVPLSGTRLPALHLNIVKLIIAQNKALGF